MLIKPFDQLNIISKNTPGPRSTARSSERPMPEVRRRSTITIACTSRGTGCQLLFVSFEYGMFCQDVRQDGSVLAAPERLAVSSKSAQSYQTDSNIRHGDCCPSTPPPESRYLIIFGQVACGRVNCRDQSMNDTIGYRGVLLHWFAYNREVRQHSLITRARR